MKSEFNLLGFTVIFPDEAACVEFLARSRWKDGIPISPFGGGEAYKIGTRPGLYKCKRTLQNFSVRHGTIFEESRLPLRKWFFGIFILHSLKKGISSIQLAKYLGVTQKTAWFMLQRIRYAVEHDSFNNPLSGTIEIDETYIEGRRPGRRGRGASGKTSVVGMVARSTSTSIAKSISSDSTTATFRISNDSKGGSPAVLCV